MKIEKCVVYVATLNPMTRINYAVVDGARRVPITLPRLKCLEEHDDVKYHPYKEDEPLPIKKKDLPLPKPDQQLSIREKRAYELHKAGVQVKDIAHEFHTSNNSVRAMISRARVKLGEQGP